MAGMTKAAMNLLCPLLLTASGLTLLITGCTTMEPVTLNEPGHAVLARNAGSMRPNVLAFERQERDGLAVSSNLAFADGPFVRGCRLTLVLSNQADKPVTLHPVVSLLDATGQTIAPMYGGSYLAWVARQAERPGPTAGASPAPATRFPPDTAGQWSQWAADYWLKEEYRLGPGEAVTAVLVFPLRQLANLPLRLTVECGGEAFDFVTFRELPAPAP